MIHSSQLLRRALLADAVFSGVSAIAMVLDIGALASQRGQCVIKKRSSPPANEC